MSPASDRPPKKQRAPKGRRKPAPARPPSEPDAPPASGSRPEGRKKLVTPQYDPSVVGSVALRVEILTVELLRAFFDRADESPLPSAAPSDAVPEIGVDVDYAISDDQTVLGCTLTFGTLFQEDEPPYELTAGFRVVYSVKPGDPLTVEELSMFAHYNAVFNAWPYWREYLSSTINRAQLPRFILPVFRVPRTHPNEESK